jgi:2-methylcitrate dehydratase PrpD
MASGSMQFLVDGAWTKRLHPALAVRNGVEAALLAADGFVGTLDGVNGERGFLSAYSAEPHSEELLSDWRSRPLEVIATSIKAHTCCRYNQGGIDAVLALRSAHGLSPDDVVRVTVGVPSVAVDIVLEPADAKRRPTSVVDAQFSLPYGVAVALRHGAAGTIEYSDEVITDPDTAAVMDRVSYQIDPDIDAAYPRQWKAWAEIETSRGDVLRHHIDEPKGDPGNPLAEDELETKFRTLCSSVVSGDVIDRVEDVVSRFGELGTFGELERAWSD